MATPSDGARDKELLFMLAENGNDVVWTMSVSGEITYVSPSVERMRGITPEEAMRQSLDEIFPPESAAIVVGYFQDLYGAVAEGREPPGNFRGELEYNCADGSTVWTEVQVMPRYGPSGELLEILGVSRDISELRAQRAALREAQVEAERQRALADERVRLARDLHDDLLQSLTAVGIDIATAEARADEPTRAQEALGRAREDLEAANAGARRLVAGLRAQPLEEHGLVGAVRVLADECATRSGVRTVVEVGDVAGIDAPVEDALFRVAQEALANVAKHADASQATVRLERRDGEMILTVVDDGRGLADGAPIPEGHFGLAGMRERMQTIGGAFAIEAVASGGTRVTARAPA